MSKRKQSGDAARAPGPEVPPAAGGPGSSATAPPHAASRSAEFRLNYLIHDVSRLRHLVFDQEMRPHGVTHAQWTALAQLSRSRGRGMTQSNLAMLLGVGKVAIGGMIDRLEASGLVERRPDAMDRRVNLVCITPKAQSILDRMAAVSRRVNRLLLEGLGREEIASTEHVLATIKRNAKALLRDADDPDGA